MKTFTSSALLQNVKSSAISGTKDGTSGFIIDAITGKEETFHLTQKLKVMNKSFLKNSLLKLAAIILFSFAGLISATAQITTLSAWTNVYHGTATTAQTVSYTIPTGSNTYRVLVVAIASCQTAVGSRTVTLTYGGQTLTSVAGDMATATVQQHTQLYYLNEAGIEAAVGTTLSVTVGGGTTRMTDVYAAVFDGVNQTSTITDSQPYTSGTATTTNPVFGTALTVNANDQAVEIINCDHTASGTLRTITYATNWTMITQQTSTATDAIRTAVVNRSVPSTNTTDASSTTFSGTALGSMTGMSLKAAIVPTFTSIVPGGNWSTPSTWDQGSVPTAGSNVVIAPGAPVTVDVNTATIGNLTINSTLDVTTNTVSGTGTLSLAASASLLVGGTNNFPSGFTTNTLNSASLVNYYYSGNQTISGQAYGNLTLSGNGINTMSAGTSVSGNLTVSGTAAATTGANLTIGGTLVIGAGSSFATGTNFTLTVNGTSSIAGTLTLAGTGTKTFTGDVTINSGGVWNETGAATINYAGNLQNDGATFTANTGTHNFTGITKTISGASTISIPTATFTGSYTNNGIFSSSTLTVTGGALTNNGTVTASTALSGTGTFTQVSNSVLNLGGTSGITRTKLLYTNKNWVVTSAVQK